MICNELLWECEFIWNFSCLVNAVRCLIWWMTFVLDSKLFNMNWKKKDEHVDNWKVRYNEYSRSQLENNSHQWTLFLSFSHSGYWTYFSAILFLFSSFLWTIINQSIFHIMSIYAIEDNYSSLLFISWLNSSLSNTDNLENSRKADDYTTNTFFIKFFRIFIRCIDSC